MIIKNIKYTKDKKNVTLSADILFKNGTERNMFFRVNKTHDRLVGKDASPFLASLLLPAMKSGEDITIEGSVPERVLNNTKDIMKVVGKWNIGLKKINIETAISNPKNTNPKFTGCFFTGGVDSFYTYLKNKKSITHFITIHGCDISLNNKEFFSQALKALRKVAYEENKNIIIVESNYREIIEPVLEWEWNLGSALGAVVLFLNPGFKKVYIPSGMKKTQLCPYGTHPDLDPLWSTSKVKIIHDGCEYGRLEKVIHRVSKSSLALRHLRVCCLTLKNKYNCNECFKCIQTKIELYCAGVLDKAETFDRKINLESVKNVYYYTELNFHIFGIEALDYLKKHNLNPALQEAIEISLNRSSNPSFLRRIASLFAHLDKKYNNRRLYTSIFGINDNQDKTFVFKAINRLGLVR